MARKDVRCWSGCPDAGIISTETSAWDATKTASTTWLVGRRLCDAAANGDEKRILRIFKDNPNVYVNAESAGKRPLHEAAESNHPGVILLLLKLGADVGDSIGRESKTALTTALINGNRQSAKLLYVFESLKYVAVHVKLDSYRAFLESSHDFDPRYWVKHLKPHDRILLAKHVELEVSSSANCYLFLFGKAAAASAHETTNSEHNLSLRNRVFHDGQQHLTKLLISFLVQREAHVRRRMQLMHSMNLAGPQFLFTNREGSPCFLVPNR